MIDFFEELNKPTFFNECDNIFDFFKKENMPQQCFGYRSWLIEKALEKYSN